jgi:hypothetical protein
MMSDETVTETKPENYQLDDLVIIWITGNTEEYTAKVIGHDAYGYPKLKVQNDPSWDPFTLKDGDYIIRRRA